MTTEISIIKDAHKLKYINKNNELAGAQGQI